MAGELAGKVILVVDDDRDILTSIQAALADLGPEVMTASDGNTAVTLAQQRSPDLVILDQMLPAKSGLLVLEAIKQGKQRSDPPRVVMITANPGHRHKDYAQSLGVDAYLNKPFRMEKLTEAVLKLIGGPAAAP